MFLELIAFLTMPIPGFFNAPGISLDLAKVAGGKQASITAPGTMAISAEKENKPAPAVYSLNVPDMELTKIVRILAEQTKTNIVLMSKPEARLTIRLEDVTLQAMLRHICSLSDLSMLQVDGTYILASEDTLKKGYAAEWNALHPIKTDLGAETITETVILKYVNAGQMVKTLSALFPAEVLTVAAGPDQKSPSIEDQSVKITGNEVTALGNEKMDGNERSGVSTGTDTSTARILVVKGARSAVQSALETVQKLDFPRKQVSIGVTVHEVTNDVVKELGLSWSFSNIVVRDRRVSGGSGSSTGISGGAFDPLSATATVKALETANKARLLASPNVSVLDGEKAYVLIGDRLKYPVVTTFSQANTPVFDVREDRIGIYLQVAANVAPDNDITLSLYPQVSTITGFLNVNGASYPQISTREAQTTLRIKSGETIIMAGLLRNDEVERTEKVPILGDIPILGELFKLRKKAKTGTQLVITITPIVTEGSKP